MFKKITKRNSLWLILTCLSGAQAAAQTTTFKITIPPKPTRPPGQIETVKLNFSLETIPPVSISGANFTVTDPEGHSFSLTGSMTDPFPIPAGAATQDVLTVLRPDMANDTAHYQRYEIDIQLKSDYNPQTCVSTRANADEFYTITVTPVLSGGSSYTASGFCLEAMTTGIPWGRA